MPEIGTPPNLNQRRFNNVAIKRLEESARKKTKKEIIEQATGSNLDPETVIQGARNNQIGKDEFLKILTHQLQNQDPLKPMDQNKFAAELAQFSQLEQLTNLNEKFDEVQENKLLEKKYLAASFIGKKIVTSGNSIELRKSGEKRSLMFNLGGEAKKVIVRLMDEKGGTVAEIHRNQMSKGPQLIEWNGRQLDGEIASAGTYKVVVKAWDKSLREVPVKTQQAGVVQSVSFQDGDALLDLGDRKVFLRDVASFHRIDQGAAQPHNKHSAKTDRLDTSSLNRKSVAPNPAKPSAVQNSPQGVSKAYQQNQKGSRQ